MNMSEKEAAKIHRMDDIISILLEVGRKVNENDIAKAVHYDTTIYDAIDFLRGEIYSHYK